MDLDFLAVLENNKNLISPETMQNVKNHIDILSEEAKARIITQINNAAFLKKMVEEYDSQRIAVLEDAKNYLEKLDQEYTSAYKETLKEAEEEESKSDISNAEDIFSQL